MLHCSNAYTFFLIRFRGQSQCRWSGRCTAPAPAIRIYHYVTIYICMYTYIYNIVFDSHARAVGAAGAGAARRRHRGQGPHRAPHPGAPLWHFMCYIFKYFLILDAHAPHRAPHPGAPPRSSPPLAPHGSWRLYRSLVLAAGCCVSL